ncbi:hypothetical protein [Streptomyces sp. ICC1]|uniref:hypothetical protein n=2 Tax=unclassified Streptomyces TaxID=2593676 RepID=UPI000DC780C1|nr:hypothetical protein [Streptomyces sp. ICC1]AWZ12152.1 hypothetical protein DRB96_07295 [Streptomyces sp. ICC1]
MKATTKRTARSATARTAPTVLAALLCAVLAGCGTVRAGEAAGPAPVAAPSPAICDLDGPTDGGAGVGTAAPDIPTDEETGAYAGPPTDENTGAYAGPPTDEETGTYAGPPTDQDTGVPDPPTDQDSGTPDPPTDGTAAPGGGGGAVTNGAGPCGAAGWFDMTRDFAAYYGEHRTEADWTVPADGIGAVRVRKVGGSGLAEVAFTTAGKGKSRGDDARRVARVFADWRREVYGDSGTVTVRSRESYPVVVTDSW